MSWTKFSVNAITEGIIRALRQSNVIADDESAQLLRNMDNSLTEAQMTNIITNQVKYGGGDEGLGGVLASPDDLVMLIDSDAVPSPWHDNKNYFRIGRAQSEKTLTNPGKVVLSAYIKPYDHSTLTADSHLVVGPDTNLISNNPSGVTNNEWYPAKLFLGAYNFGTSPRILGMLATGEVHSDGGAAFRMHGAKRLELSSINPHVAEFTYSTQLFYSGNDSRTDSPPGNPKTLGGFHSGATSICVFYVGDRYVDPGTSADCLTIQRKTQDLCEIRNENDSDHTTTTRPTINLTSASAQYTGIVSVNANRSVTARNPATHENPSFSVYGPTDTSSPPIILAVSTMTNFYGEVLELKTYDTTSGGAADRYNFILARRYNGASFDPVFRVSNRGYAYATAWYTSGIDVAEYVPVDSKDYEYGTVLCIGNGDILIESTIAEDSKIAGVVAEQPGVLLGGMHSDDEPTDKLPMTVCGFTPVNCTTIAGNISPGDLLVSSTGGRAQKAGDDPKVGTILGKAFGSLIQEGDEPKTGRIKALIILQ